MRQYHTSPFPSYNRIRSSPIANRTDNRINHGTMELQDKLQDCRTMRQWDYETNYGTTIITGSAAVPLPTGQTMGSQDNGTMG